MTESYPTLMVTDPMQSRASPLPQGSRVADPSVERGYYKVYPDFHSPRVGLAYAVSNAILGDSAEYVALSLKAVGVMMAIAFLFSQRLPKQAKYLHHDL